MESPVNQGRIRSVRQANRWPCAYWNSQNKMRPQFSDPSRIRSNVSLNIVLHVDYLSLLCVVMEQTGTPELKEFLVIALQIIHDPILLRHIETEAGVSPQSRYGRTPETAVLRRNLPRLHSRPTRSFSFRAHHANVLTVERRCR